MQNIKRSHSLQQINIATTFNTTEAFANISNPAILTQTTSSSSSSTSSTTTSPPPLETLKPSAIPNPYLFKHPERFGPYSQPEYPTPGEPRITDPDFLSLRNRRFNRQRIFTFTPSYEVTKQIGIITDIRRMIQNVSIQNEEIDVQLARLHIQLLRKELDEQDRQVHKDIIP